MGFLDKAKQLAQQAETQLNQATGQAGGAPNARAADAWLRELGQWVYADRMGRDPRAAAEVEVRIQQLQQWEQQHGTQVQTPFPSPGTAPGGMAPSAVPAAPAAPAPTAPTAPAAPIPGTVSEAPTMAASIPGTLSDAPAGAAPIPSTSSSPPGAPTPPPVAPGPPSMPSPGGSLGALDAPPATAPLTVPPVAAPPAAPAPPDPVSAPAPPAPVGTEALPSPPVSPPVPPPLGPPSDRPSPPS